VEEDPSEENTGLKILKLGWCGRAFGRRAVEALLRLSLCSKLEALEMSGLFRLNDNDLIKLLGECPTLTSLEMPYKSTVSLACAKALTAPALPLTSLSLAHSAQVRERQAITVVPVNRPSSRSDDGMVYSGACRWSQKHWGCFVTSRT